jgi:tRNA pseudouridine55 synthase
VNRSPAHGATPEAAAIERGGVLVVDKPAGPTSHDVVTVVRRALGNAKTGHTGTLDPAATGVLPVVVGRATRLAKYFAAAEKEYLAEIRLGASTDTYDATGSVTFETPAPWPSVSRDELDHAFSTLRSRVTQLPPAYSAKLAGGVRAYEQARKGNAVGLAEVSVEVRSLDVVSVEDADVTVRLVTSAGFYVRSFANDLGQLLGLGAHLRSLRRLRSGVFGLDLAVTLDLVVNERAAVAARMVGIDHLLLHLPAVELTEEGCAFVAHGRLLEPRVLRPLAGTAESGPVRLLGPGGTLFGLGQPGPGGALHPVLVLV